LQAGLAGHADVEDSEVDRFVEGLFDGFGAVGRFGDDSEVRLVVEDAFQPFADERVVVGDEDSGDGGNGH
jgi:hypothetical protein